MPSTVFDSALFRDMFGTAEMRAVFSDEALVGRYLETEAALARAQARAGVIPQSAAAAISTAAQAVVINFDKLRQETETMLRQECDEQAQKNLRGFIEAFGDGHLELKWPKPSDQKTADQTSSNSTSAPEQQSICPRLGYKRSLTPGVDFSQLPACTSFVGGDAHWFLPAGILQLQNRTNWG